MKGSEFVFDSADSLYYKLYRKSLKYKLPMNGFE